MTARTLGISILAFTLLFSFTPVAAAPAASEASAGVAEVDLATALSAIRSTLEERRKELGVPGLAMAIVRDDEVIFNQGFGVRDAAKKLPVTPDTLFAIGSCTKAFTATAVMIGVEQGQLGLDDPPKKYLPYFKLRDPEADEKITVRDLMTHGSGLGSTDLAWYTGVLDREEVIRVAGLAKPTAGFREKYQYQNVMFSAAGEVVARAAGTDWNKLIDRRFFKPLGMKSSNTSIKKMLKSKNHALGYDITNKPARRLPIRDLTNIAAAGAINSNTTDMSRWLRLALGRGALEDQRLLSEENFEKLVTPQEVSQNYGLGWGLSQWRGRKVVAHSGGIDGFSSLVSFMPGERIGFVLLANVTASPIGSYAANAVWSNLVEPQATPTEAAVEPVGPEGGDTEGKAVVEAESEVGTFDFAEAGFKIEIVLRDGQLTMVVPGQPSYALTRLEGRRYKLGAPAPAGFFITFRPMKDKPARTEAYLEQPQGNYVLPKISAEDEAAAAAAVASYDGPHKDLLGRYSMNAVEIEVTVRDGKVTLTVPGQPPYPLSEKEADVFGADNLPASYRIQVVRDDAGKVEALRMTQPQGEFEARRIGDIGAAPAISVDDLISKMIEAGGGVDTLSELRTMVMHGRIELENQGVTANISVRAKAPSSRTTTVEFRALGKSIGTVSEYFDGSAGTRVASFTPTEVVNGAPLDDLRVSSSFNPLLDWKSLFPTTRIRSMSKIGDEDVYVVVKTPERGSPVTEYVSAASFLLLKRESTENSLTVVETFDDYRTVDGASVPFGITVENPGTGTWVVELDDVRFNVEVPDEAFRPGAAR